MNGTTKYHALKVDTEKCFGCTHCMKICPTEAIRVVGGKAVIDEARCVDCGNCLRACPVDAICVIHDSLRQIASYPYRVVLFPSVFVGQFSEKYSEDQIYAALLKLGFTHIFEVEQPAEWLMESIRESRKEVSDGPLISSFCPAVVRLIQCKYPSLTGNISKRKAPHDLAAHFAISQLMKKGARREEIGIFYVSPCSAKLVAVKQPVAEEKSIVTGTISMKELYNRVMKLIPAQPQADFSASRKYLSREGILWSLPRGESSWFRKKSMAIDGIHNVVRFLERLESGDVPELDFLELKSCNLGCAGGILLSGNRFLTVERLQKRAANYPRAARAEPADFDKEAVKRLLVAGSIDPEPVFVLDRDRTKAIRKMQKINVVFSRLPGIDCGGCGAPNCHALAEDIVQGKARMLDCVFLQNKYIGEQKLKPEKAYESLYRIWGVKRFEADYNKKGGRNESF